MNKKKAKCACCGDIGVEYICPLCKQLHCKDCAVDGGFQCDCEPPQLEKLT